MNHYTKHQNKKQKADLIHGVLHHCLLYEGIALYLHFDVWVFGCCNITKIAYAINKCKYKSIHIDTQGYGCLRYTNEEFRS